MSEKRKQRLIRVREVRKQSGNQESSGAFTSTEIQPILRDEPLPFGREPFRRGPPKKEIGSSIRLIVS
jgi:hypothetical protein